MRNYSILLLAIIVLGAGSVANARYSGGTGEPNDPYLIATAEDLNDIGNHQDDWDKHFILVNDVNLAEYTGTQFNIIGNDSNVFTGVFDGNDHKVWNFTWSSTGKNSIGLFRYVGSGGQIKNLGMENVNVNAGTGYHVGGLVGESYEGTISNCYAAGEVSGYSSWVGGLVGYNWDSTISNCYATGSVTGEEGTGGLVGRHLFGMISDCYAIEAVSGYDYLGGLVGDNWEGTISSCNADCDVEGIGWFCGGLAGCNVGAISDCYADGYVDGGGYTGGLVGVNIASISNCYAIGSVNGGNKTGGLVGENGDYDADWGKYYSGYIYNCYSTGEVLGSSNVGGLVGIHIIGEIGASFWDVNTSGQTSSAGGTPKTTAEMKTRSTFTDAGWDFVEIWDIGEHQTYPYLRFAPAGDLNYDKKVDFFDLAILASHWLEER